MTEYYKILRIEDTLSNLSQGQIGVEASSDPILGVSAWGGKDYSGNVSKFAVLGLDSQFSDLQLIGSSTTGDEGLLKHDASGNVTGGQMTIEDLNDYISDGPIGPAYWDRDISGYLFPVTDTDTIIVGDGAESAPAIAFKNGTNSGFRYDSVDDDLRFVHNGDDILTLTKYSTTGINIETETGRRYFTIKHARTSGSNEPTFTLQCSGTGSIEGSKLSIQSLTSVTSSTPAVLELYSSGGYANTYIDAIAGDPNHNAAARLASTANGGSANTNIFAETSSSNSGHGASLFLTAKNTGAGNSAIWIGTDVDAGTSAIYIGTDASHFVDGLYFVDVNKTSASPAWSSYYGVPLSSTVGAWNNYKATFGEVGLMDAIYAASTMVGPAALTAGYVGYGSATNELTGEASFFYDAANNYLGIGHATPDCGLHVGANNPTYSSGGSDAFITGDLEVLSIDLINTIRGHGFTAGSIPYFSGSPPALTEDNTDFYYKDSGAKIAVSGSSSSPISSYFSTTNSGTAQALTVIEANHVTGTAQVILRTVATAGSTINMSNGLMSLGADDITLNADDDISFDDGNRSGSSWSSGSIDFSASSAEWSNMETLIGSEGSLFGGILAAAETLVAEGAAETANSTTSGSFQQRLRVTTPSLTSGVGYLILWSVELQAGDDCEVQGQVQLNDSTTIAEPYYDNDPYSTRGQGQAGIYYSDSLSGVYNIDFDWRKAYDPVGGRLVYCGRCRIVVLRVNL